MMVLPRPFSRVLTRPLALPLLGAVALALLVTPPSARADTKEEIFQRCADNIKQEFGAAEVSFETFRRADGRDMAFGTLQMTDGTTRPIRCRLRNGRALDVRFKTSSKWGGDQAWTKDRPDNAGFIAPEEEETAPSADRVAAQPPAGDGTEPAEGPGVNAAQPQAAAPNGRRLTPGTGRVGAQATGGTAQTAAAGAATAGAGETQTAGTAPAAGQTADGAERAETPEEPRRGPVFKKPPVRQ